MGYYAKIIDDLVIKVYQKNESNDSTLIKIESVVKEGYFYDTIKQRFVPPQPYPSWKLNEDTCLWDAPIPYPSDDKQYIWNEKYKKWTNTGWLVNSTQATQEQ